MTKIKCPKCGHNQAIAAIWGTATIFNDENGEICLDIRDVEIDNGDYFECPKCEYQGPDIYFKREER